MTDDGIIDAYRAQGKFVSTTRGMLFLNEQGSGDPVLFLHGIPTYSYLWRDVLPSVALERLALAPDLLGFGLSEKQRDADYSVGAQADAIRSLLVQLEIERVAIVCHDFGALVAAELYTRFPELYTKLIILNTSLRRESWSGGSSPLSLLRIPMLGEFAMTVSQRWMLKLAMKVYVNRDNRLTDDVMGHYWWPFTHGYKGTLLNMSRSKAATNADFGRWREALRESSLPCLIIWGEDDPTFTLDEAHDLAYLIPQSRLEIFEHANHFVPEDRPLATGRLINAFLDGTL